MMKNVPESSLSAALNPIQAILFDLDGTLADTAPDLAAVTNKMLSVRNLPSLPLATLRPLASAGVAGLMGEAFGINAQHQDFAALREEFLACYATDLCIHTKLFPGIEVMLTDISVNRIRWGIVTNKIAKFAEPLTAQLGLQQHALCLVSGDTTPHAKPHPAPLLHAAAQLKVAPAQVIYVGDDQRDVQAGQAAGMLTIAAAYGYCGKDQPPEAWNADYIVYSTAQLHALLRNLMGTEPQG